jgi:PAS domain S-box-containing protein
VKKQPKDLGGHPTPQRADEELRQSEERFRTMANAIPQLAWIAKSDGYIFWYNQRWYDYTGTTPEEMEGWGWQSVHDPEMLPKVLEQWKAAIATGKPFDMVFPLRGSDGQFRPFLTRVMPLKGAGGQVIQWFGTNTDITERKRAEEALREAQRDLNRAQAVAHTGSWRLDLRRNELLWSEETYRMFGIAPDTPMTYEVFLSVVHPEDREFVDREWTAALGGKPYNIEHRIVVGDTVKWVRERAELDFDPQGALLSGFGTVQDITERKQWEKALKQSEEHYRSLFNNMLNGYAYCRMHFEQDRPVDFTYLKVNEVFETLTGLKNVTGKKVSECIPGIRKTNPELFEIYGRVALTGKPQQFETYLDPLKRWFSISVYSPQKEHFVAVFDDITERKRTEEDLRQRTAQLERANREMEAFSHSVFHDLKGPLRVIGGFSRMLIGEHADQLDAEGRRLLKVIIDNTKLMHQLIDDLRALDRLGRMLIRKSRIDMDTMTRQVFEQLRAKTPERDIRLTVTDLPSALGDQSLLYQVLENLLSNAIKYTKPRKTAVLEVGGKDEETETIYYVKDNGVGIDDRYVSNLFRAFQRPHIGEEGYEGTGVGLAIVKRIIGRHGGRVWAEGKVDVGATFYFALPKNGR